MMRSYNMNKVRDQDVCLRHIAGKDVPQPVAEIIRRVWEAGE